MKKCKFKIYWEYKGRKEVVDEADNLADLSYLLDEYKLAYRGMGGRIFSNLETAWKKCTEKKRKKK